MNSGICPEKSSNAGQSVRQKGEQVTGRNELREGALVVTLDVLPSRTEWNKPNMNLGSKFLLLNGRYLNGLYLNGINYVRQLGRLLIVAGNK